MLVLTETIHFEKNCLKLDGSYSLYNSGPTGGQQDIGWVGFLHAEVENKLAKLSNLTADQKD